MFSERPLLEAQKGLSEGPFDVLREASLGGPIWTPPSKNFLEGEFQIGPPREASQRTSKGPSDRPIWASKRGLSENIKGALR